MKRRQFLKNAIVLAIGGSAIKEPLRTMKVVIDPLPKGLTDELSVSSLANTQSIPIRAVDYLGLLTEPKEVTIKMEECQAILTSPFDEQPLPRDVLYRQMMDMCKGHLDESSRSVSLRCKAGRNEIGMDSAHIGARAGSTDERIDSVTSGKDGITISITDLSDVMQMPIEQHSSAKDDIVEKITEKANEILEADEQGISGYKPDLSKWVNVQYRETKHVPLTRFLADNGWLNNLEDKT